MTDWFSALCGSGFMPHGMCYQWEPGLIWLHVLSDTLIALAYFSIPLTLVYFVRKRNDVPYRTLILMFSAFIIACGTTHLMEVWTVWHPHYWISGFIKSITALISLTTAAMLIRFIPIALDLPGPTELARANEALEQRVRTRTADLNAANERLRHSEQQLDLTLEGADMGRWDWHVPTQRVEFDHRWCEMLGFSREEIAPHYTSWERLVHPDDKAATLATIEEHLAGRIPQYEAEYRMRTRSGGWKWILDRGRVMERDEQGRPVRMVGTHLDTTLRKETELALRRERERIGTIFQALSEGVVMYDRNARPLECNQAAEKILGYSREEILSGAHQHDNAVHEDGSTWSPGDFPSRVTLRTGESLRDCVMGAPRPDGATVWLSVNAEPIRDADGRPAACVVSFTDISQRKQADADRERIQAKMLEAQKLESLGVLAGGIAHDFNNLLTGVLGNAGLARFDLPENSSLDRILVQIEQSALRASDLCKQMLAYSGKGRFVIEPVDLNVVIHDTVNLLKASIQKKAELRLNLTPDLPAINADAAQIQQVIMNLATNAAEAIGDRPGHITVATGVVDADRSYLSQAHGEGSLPPGRYVWLEISDDGSGIKPELVGKIFDPFFTTKFTGRGLGLAAVLGIARGHQGAVKVYSELGRGSSFKVLFPSAAGAVTPRSTEPATARTWRGSGEVLIIDDEETVRLAAAGLLRAVGFNPTVAADGHDGLMIFQMGPERFDVVLLDLTMPNMDGEEVFRRLRMIRPEVKVVLMSGFNKVQAVDRFSGKGLAGFVQKPFTLDALTTAMRRALDSTPPF